MSRSTPLRREYGLDGCFVALFTGNVGSYSSVHTAVEAASLLADLPEFRLVVAGRGNARPALEEQVRSLGLRNTLFLDTQPPERLAELFASADVSLVTLDERIRRTAVPSKLLTILASGRPAIVCASPDNEAATIVREGRCGTALPPDDPPALARELRRAMAEGDRLQAEGARGRELAVARYSRASQTARYRMLLHEVVSQPDG
jgi:colanic acid biosynthesis glycosyl transferase WcaI